MKKIMILGASILQLPAIQKAKAKGLEVIVADMNPNAVGFKEKGIKKEIISTIDIESITAAAKKHKIDGIMTLATDMPMRCVAVVAKELGIIGISEETALKSTDKIAMRRAFEKNHVEIPNFFEVSNKEDFFKTVSFFENQFIVKPADNSGSRGVFLVDRNSSDTTVMEEIYEYSRSFSRNGFVIVEEYMQGPEVSVEMLSMYGECHILQITDKLTTGAPHFVEIGHSQPSCLSEKDINSIKKLAVSAVNAFESQEFIESFYPLLSEYGLWRFACILSQICHIYLGLDHKEWFGKLEYNLCEDLMEYIFSSGNFGSKGTNFAGLFIQNTEVSSSNKFLQLFLSVKKIVILHWPKANKSLFLLGIGFIYFPVKYVFNALIGKRKRFNPVAVLKTGENSNKIFRQLELYKSKEQKISQKGDDILANLFFSLVRSAACGTLLSPEEKELINDSYLKKLYKLSARHDLTHLVAFALQQNGLLDIKTPIGDGFQHFLLMSVVRYTKLNYEAKRIYNAFEKAKIPFIPLKGAVIRKYYPEPWMRTSCDIDILIHPEDMEKATAVLVDEINYTVKEKTNKDISFASQSEVRLELHFSPIGKDVSGDSILKNIWDHALPAKQGKYQHILSNSMFVFFHFAHMAKHFSNGGCGIRPFVDIWLLKNNGKLYSEECTEFLKASELSVFSEAAIALSDVWFSGKEHTDLTLKMQKYILFGGTYGSYKNGITVKQLKKGGRLKYALHRIFMPFDTMLKLYPNLENRKILLPFYYIHRILIVVSSGRGKTSLNELFVNSSSNKKSSEIKNLFKELKLL